MKLRFIFSQTFKGLLLNKAMAASVVLVTLVSLVFVGSASLLHKQIDNLKNDWYDKVEVTVFMCPSVSQEPQCVGGEATQKEIDDIAAFLKTPDMTQYVEKVYFETKEQALESFKRQLGDSEWANALTADEMQVSYRIKLKDPQQYQIVADELKNRPGVESVADQRAQLEPLFNLMRKLTIIASSLAGVMILTAIMLISNTIRLSAMSRRTETEIMRYVGASNRIIQVPFMLECVLSAVAGSVLAVGFLYVTIHYFVEQWFGQTMGWIVVVTGHDVLLLAPWLIGSAILLACLTSLVSLRRYLKV